MKIGKLGNAISFDVLEVHAVNKIRTRKIFRLGAANPDLRSQRSDAKGAFDSGIASAAFTGVDQPCV